MSKQESLVPSVQTLPTAYVGDRHVEGPAGCYFYHTLDLPGHGTVEGGWDLRGRFEDYIGHVDLRGKRFLDVGTASGFLSFEAERLGAARVTSFDMDTAERQHLLPFQGSEYVDDHPNWCRKQTAAFKAWQRSYWLTHRLYKSQAVARYGDVYHLPSDIGRFDVVLLGAILEHLVDPLSALREVARVTDDLLIINTDYFDTPMPVACFKGRADLPTHSYVFWTYSIAIYDQYMAIMGFEKIVERKDHFAGTRPTPTADRPMVERIALVYRRKGARAK